MDDSLHAARQGDLILHPPLMAELVSTLTEAVVYAAATAAVAAAIGGAVVAVVGTGGAAAVLTPLIAGALVGAAAMLPGGEDKSIGDQISHFSSWVGNSMFPPEPYGAIETGSVNTHINGLPAARAAGISNGPTPPGGGDTAAEPSVLETVGSYAMAAGTMLLPIIGLASAISDIFNPPVTTPADANTDPRPLDKAICSKHPPMPEQFVAQGSGKVFINGQPAARVGDKTTCDGPIGMTFSPNVRIGGKTVTVRDIHDGKSALAKVIGLVAGMLIARKGMLKSGRACRVGNPVLPSTGAKLQDGPQDIDFDLPALLPIEWARTYHSADMRNDGLLGMGWSVPFEVRLERVAHPEGGELWIYIDEIGTRLELGRLQPGNAFVSVLDGLAFYHQDAGITIVEDIHAGRYQVFQTDPTAPHRSRLVKLGDRNLNSLQLFYDDDGRLRYLGDTFSRTFIGLCYDTTMSRRVSEVQRLRLLPGEQFSVERAESLVRYSYTAQGQLHTVTDACGHVVRQFSYTEDGLMASHTLASGATRHYQWASFVVSEQGPAACSLDGEPYQLPVLLEAQPQQEWRVVRHWGSDGEHYQFEYDLDRGHTRVIDGLGRVEHFHWGPQYLVHEHIDALGNSWREDHTGGLVRKRIEPDGGQWHYTHDALGRLTSTRDPLGRVETLQYTEQWALPLSITDFAGRTRLFSYDRHGNLVAERDPLGHETRYHYDRQGRLERLTDAQGRERELRWSDQGQLLSQRDCSGSQTRYFYDANNHLAQVINARGERSEFRHDVLGRLLEHIRPDGRREQFTVDAAGRRLRQLDPLGNLTQWRYDGSGRLLQRTDALGLTLQFDYDAYGRLLRLGNENAEAYRFEWDALDRLASQQNLDGSGHSYRYNAVGEVTCVRDHPAPRVDSLSPADPAEPPAKTLQRDFELDAAGRLIRKRTDDGVTDYRYDDADNLLSIGFTGCGGERKQLDFGYDALDQPIHETASDARLEFAYDELGNLQTLTLPDQRKLNYLYYGSAHLHQINLDGRVICDFERDNLHDEVLRTQGRLRTLTQYDTSGRLARKAVFGVDASAADLALLQKDYRYDEGDNLREEVYTRSAALSPIPGAPSIPGRFDSDGRGGQASNRYDYGPTERIHAATRTTCDGTVAWVENYAFDRAGNLLDGYSLKGHVRHDRVQVYQDKRYTYDAFGRLHEKRSGNRLVQRFVYDAEHRLIRIHQQRGPLRERLEFTYDPLGRRVAKALYREDHTAPVSRTRFLWEGMRLLMEEQDGKTSLYVYIEPDSHEPLARVDGSKGQEEFGYFHSNLAGLAEQLTDEQGQTIWHSDYLVWGNNRCEWHAATQSRQQNLRFQGQYLDRESGLHYNTFRFYDPDIGRFTQPDPIGLQGGLNLMVYAPNPMAWIDEQGLECWPTSRRKYWKAEAKGAPRGMYSKVNMIRMRLGLAPRIRVRELHIATGKVRTRNVSLELNHRRWPQRSGKHVSVPYNLEKVTPWEHAAVDPYRHTGTRLLKVLQDIGNYTGK